MEVTLKHGDRNTAELRAPAASTDFRDDTEDEIRIEVHVIAGIVQNGIDPATTFMSSMAGQRGSPSDRVRQEAEIRALDEARRVPWRILANTADEYTEWQVFALWLRAVLDLCEALPAEIALEIQKRSPFLLSRIETEFCNPTLSPGATAWECVTEWAEANIFAEPMRKGWLNAVRYFSSKSLLSIKAWAYWEEVYQQWHERRPAVLPNYVRWTSSVFDVSRLSNPESELQRILESVHSVPQAKCQHLFDAFLELTALCLWVEILMGAGQAGAEIILRDLTLLYPRFDVSAAMNSNTPLSTITEWVMQNEPPFGSAEMPLLALSYYVKCHPAYYSRRNYAAHCRAFWGGGHFHPLPSFAEWRSAADGYFER